jgi:hypothetical protein
MVGAPLGSQRQVTVPSEASETSGHGPRVRASCAEADAPSNDKAPIAIGSARLTTQGTTRAELAEVPDDPANTEMQSPWASVPG